MKNRFWTIAALAAAVGLSLGRQLPAQVSTPNAAPPLPAVVDPGNQGETPAKIEPGIPADLKDLAFEHYLDLSALGRAWVEMDASLMADCGLQLAEGERVLLRSHKAITADRVLDYAVRIAAEKKDEATLKRLSRAAEVYGSKSLATKVSTAQKLASSARAVEPAHSVAVDQTSVAGFAIYKALLAGITAAKLAEDGQTLETIAKMAPRMEALSKDQQQFLVKSAGEAQAALSTTISETDESLDVLKKLGAASRSYLAPPDLTGTWTGHPGNATFKITKVGGGGGVDSYNYTYQATLLRGSGTITVVDPGAGAAPIVTVRWVTSFRDELLIGQIVDKDTFQVFNVLIYGFRQTLRLTR